jgi:Fe-S cluster assembly iron-binding protein IscA
MLTVTEAAGVYLTEILAEANAADDTAVRFVVQENKLAPYLDNARPGDATFDHEGRTILVLDEGISQTLANSTLDVKDTDTGVQLVLKN